MRIYYLTGGAANMYCGSCIRDNALAAELIRQGHKVLLIPLYTPTLTDEPNVSQRKVFFGGISIFLEERSSFFRNAPRLLDRIFDSPALLVLLSKLSIRTDAARLGPLTVSMLQGEHGHQNKEFAKLLEWIRTQPLPDIVSLPYTLLISLAAPLKRALGCTVTCTLQGEDLFLEGLREPYKSRALDLIRSNVQHVDAFIAVSNYYADFMREYLRIPPHKIHVVPLGVNLTGFPESLRPAPQNFTVGYFARVAPEKGLHTLCEAYRILRRDLGLPPSRLEAAGYSGADHRDYLRRTESQMKSWGLASEFRYHGILDREEKIRFLSNLSVLSVPSSYVEPKGIFLLEAMACGTPVIQPHHGAFPEIISRTGGGLLVPPGDPRALAEALLSLYNDPARASDLGRSGFEGVRRHYTVQHMTARALEVFDSLLSQRSGVSSQSSAAAR